MGDSTPYGERLVINRQEQGANANTIAGKAISREPDAVTLSSRWLWSMMNEGMDEAS